MVGETMVLTSTTCLAGETTAEAATEWQGASVAWRGRGTKHRWVSGFLLGSKCWECEGRFDLWGVSKYATQWAGMTCGAITQGPPPYYGLQQLF